MKNNVQFITEEQAYRYMPNSSIEKDVLDNVRYTIDNNKFAGNFYSSSWQGGGDGFLYELDDYDGYVVGAQKLKEGEKIYRYFTRRSAVSGIKPLIKINIDKGLLYFLKPDDEDLDLIEFETKGIPVRYLNIIPPEKQEFAEGGDVDSKDSVSEFDYNLLKKDFDKIVDSGLFEDVHLSKFDIQIVGGLQTFTPYYDIYGKHYQTERFGEYFEIEEVIEQLKKISGRNLAYKITKSIIPEDVQYDEWEEKPKGERMLFKLIPIPKKMAEGGELKEYLSSRKDMFDDNAKTITKKDILEVIGLSKNSDKKYWVKDLNTKYSYYIYKGNLRANDGTGGIFSTTIISPNYLKDEHRFKVEEVSLYDWEKEKDPSIVKVGWDAIKQKFDNIFWMGEDGDDEIFANEVKLEEPVYNWDGRPSPYTKRVSFSDAKSMFLRSLTDEEKAMIELEYDYKDVHELFGLMSEKKIIVKRKKDETKDFLDDFENIDFEDSSLYLKYGGKVYSKYAEGGKIRWQDVFTGDGALVISENKMGYVVKPYGRRFHLRFPDGSEKTYSAEELEFYKDNDYAQGGQTHDELGSGVLKRFRHKHIPTMTYDVIDYTSKGYKGIQKDSKSLSAKERKEGKIAYYSKSEIKELFDEEMAKGGMFAKGGEVRGEKGLEEYMFNGHSPIVLYHKNSNGEEIYGIFKLQAMPEKAFGELIYWLIPFGTFNKKTQRIDWITDKKDTWRFEHHWIPTQLWLKADEINFDEWNFTKDQLEKYKTKNNRETENILDKSISELQARNSFAKGGTFAEGGEIFDDEGNVINLKVGDKVVQYKKSKPNESKKELGGQGEIVSISGVMAKVNFPSTNYENWYPMKDLKKFAEGGMTKTTKNTKNNMIFDKNGERRVDPEALEYIETEVKMLPQTKFMHTDTNGKYSAKRKKLHEEIIGHFHEGKPCVNKRPAVAILTGGAPASGKTTFIKKYVDLDPDKVYHVDADEVRAMLPEYKGWNASQTHLETADIVNTLIDEIGIPCEHDLIYDGTMNKATKYEKIVDKLHKLGYKVFVIYISIPEQVSKERVIARYQKSGRYVPMGVIEEVYDNGLTAFEKVARDMADGYIRIDGMTGEVIEQGGIPMPKNIEYEKGGELDDDKYKNATALVRSAERYTEVETGEPVKKGMGMARASKKDGKMKYDSVVVFLNNGEQVVYDEDEFPKFFMKDGGELGSQDYYDGFQMQVVQKKGIPDKEVQKENTKMRYRKGGKL